MAIKADFICWRASSVNSKLVQLEVSVIKDGHYSLTFGSDDREGELVLAK